MELDELKKDWNSKGVKDQQRSVDNIASLLNSDTASVLHKIKKSIVIELVISFAFAALSVYVILFSYLNIYKILYSVVGILCILFIAVLYFLLKKINAALKIYTVKKNLEQIIHITEEYTKRYMQLTMLLLPICFVFGVWLSYNDPEMAMYPLTWKTVIILLLCMLMAMVLLYAFTKWYLRKLYGNYIQQLKTLLKEFDEE